jgi:hypothetical protein
LRIDDVPVDYAVQRSLGIPVFAGAFAKKSSAPRSIRKKNQCNFTATGRSVLRATGRSRVTLYAVAVTVGVPGASN